MTEVISVRFRGGCKTYFFDPRGVQVTAGEHVIVETAQGLEYAQCAEGNHEVPDEQVVEPFRPMVRIATDHDRRVLERNRAREKEAFDVCQKKILQHKLEMKLVRVECSFDGNKILFFFTADGRVDFRELVKDLASCLPGPHRAAADRRPGRGKDAGRPGDLRPALLLRPVSGRFHARLHQDGQDPEPVSEPHENFRHLRAAHVLPEI